MKGIRTLTWATIQSLERDNYKIYIYIYIFRFNLILFLKKKKKKSNFDCYKSQGRGQINIFFFFWSFVSALTKWVCELWSLEHDTYWNQFLNDIYFSKESIMLMPSIWDVVHSPIIFLNASSYNHIDYIHNRVH